MSTAPWEHRAGPGFSSSTGGKPEPRLPRALTCACTQQVQRLAVPSELTSNLGDTGAGPGAPAARRPDGRPGAGRRSPPPTGGRRGGRVPSRPCPRAARVRPPNSPPPARQPPSGASRRAPASQPTRLPAPQLPGDSGPPPPPAHRQLSSQVFPGPRAGGAGGGFWPGVGRAGAGAGPGRRAVNTELRLPSRHPRPHPASRPPDSHPNPADARPGSRAAHLDRSLSGAGRASPPTPPPPRRPATR